MKKTLVLGASENKNRYSNMAIKQLRLKGHPVVAIGKKSGQVEDVFIVTQSEKNESIHTVTLYLNPKNQEVYYDYLLQLKPERLIFNPGTENDTLKKLAEEQGIKTLEACTLVLLSTDQY